MKNGENRLIRKETKLWSISNQANIILDEDTIVTIECTTIGSDSVFVKPKQLLFNFPGYIPTLIGRGVDEWSLSYSKTESYDIPQAQF